LRRGDGQVVQVSELLHLVVSAVDPARTREQVAAAVSGAYGRTLTTDGLTHLVENRLAPLGLVEGADERTDVPPRARPLLALTLKGTIVPAGAVRVLAGLLAPLFWPPVVLAALVGIVLLDARLITQGSLIGALQDVLATPTLLLALYALLTFGSLAHETGHAAACRYGGAQPGEIGFGVYVVFPAFYTDVTDSYRLSRAGRVRTDLGGLYFNVLCLLTAGWVYLATGNGLFLLVVLVMHLEMAQQLVPAVRFDGYYILADLAGVPDLFARVRPVLRSLLPGRPTDPRVAELRPYARRLVVGWVLVVVPLLTFAFGWLLWHLPLIVERTWTALGVQADQIGRAWGDRDVAVVVLSAISVALLALPLLGLAVLFGRLTMMLAARLQRMAEASTAAAEAPSAPSDLTPMPLTAAAFNDADMLIPRQAAPTRGWQRTVHLASAGTLRPRPGSAEQHREALKQRLRAPIEGSRRVVVMSRKGGVGKTTMTLALGSTFSSLRGDRVVAVDANPDAGNLAHRVAPPSSHTITDLLQKVETLETYAQLRRYVSQATESRLEVLGSDDDPRIGMALTQYEYHRLIALLDRFYNLILLDTGTGILDSANQGLLLEADELVLVMRQGLDGGRAAALTLDWLDEHDYGELVTRAVVVINGVRKGVGVPLDPMVKHFSRRCARVVTVPWDPALETGAQTRLSSLNRRTRESLVEMAAAVADNFVLDGARR
jgi:putative peptide zinc metalloprotease protein